MNTNELKDYVGGPRTSEGKENSSKNSTRHGLCSNTVRLLAHEKPEDYHALEATWFNAYTPSDQAETRLVKQLIDADFLLERANKAVAEVEAQMYEFGQSPLNWRDDQHLKLARMTRYQTSRANSVIKARKAIEDYRKNRSREDMQVKREMALLQKTQPPRTVMEAIRQASLDKLENLRRIVDNNPGDAKAAEDYRCYREKLKQKGHL